MYQQHLKDEKSTSLTDFLLVVLFLLIAVFMRQIVDFCAALPAPWAQPEPGSTVPLLCGHMPLYL